jgi:hypothetical protein
LAEAARYPANLERGLDRTVNPRVLLHLEGAAELGVCLMLYGLEGGSWRVFLLCFMLPDISLLGYLANARVGAIFYNAIHSQVAPLALAGYSAASGSHAGLLAALIWLAHIGFDRMIGFGLKYQVRFKDTHLNPVRHTRELGMLR